MALHYFSKLERRQHLQELIDALTAFLPELERSGHYLEQLPDYRKALAEARQFLEQGFSQEDLNELSRRIPQLFWLHKEWVPPLEPSSLHGAAFVEPEWYKRLEPFESRVREFATRLRFTGEY